MRLDMAMSMYGKAEVFISFFRRYLNFSQKNSKSALLKAERILPLLLDYFGVSRSCYALDLYTGVSPQADADGCAGWLVVWEELCVNLVHCTPLRHVD